MLVQGLLRSVEPVYIGLQMAVRWCRARVEVNGENNPLWLLIADKVKVFAGISQYMRPLDG